MSGLCGWLDLEKDGLDPRPTLAEMEKGLLPAPAERETRSSGTVTVAGAADVQTSPEAITAAIVGSPRWAEPHLAHIAQTHGHARALVEAYRHHDVELFERLQGPFVAVVVDPKAKRLVAAIDRIGQYPFCYAATTRGLVFGTTADAVRAHPWVEARLSAHSIYDYVYFHAVPAPASIYEVQHKLPGAHYLDYHAGRLNTGCYWVPRFTESAPASADALAREMRDVIRQAVSRASDDETPLGTFLSGGLDSSTIAGVLAQMRPGAANSYTIGFAAEGYDETRYARAAAEHFHLHLHEYYLNPQDVVDVVPRIAASYDEPFGNSSVVAAYYCATRAAADGVGRLLAGDGGDELFGGNARYAKQRVFERYGALPTGVRKGLVEPLLDRLPGGLPLVQKARSYVRQANVPLPDRLQTYNYLHSHPAREIFAPDFLAAVDLQAPLRLLRERYAQPAGASALSRMLYLDWQLTLADSDLRKVSRMSALAGVEVAYPFLDDDVVALSCRIPSRWKLKGRKLRHFYKRAMRGFLPSVTLNKSKHGFGLPFGVWMRSHEPLRELAYDSVSGLKRRGYFQPAFLDEALRLHRDVHAAYYGELLWVLMMLELWLGRRSG